MHRRSFIRNTALCAVAVSASGFIRFNGSNYTGDCETTTDILGPFYRPGSPMRTDLTVKGDAGIAVTLSGTIRHNDCTTPYKKAKVELWHCNKEGVYDNTTDEFRYRGTAYTDDEGHYSFNTILPVPYAQPNGLMRPAHFHLMITADGYMPFITQLYFTGDAYLKTDMYSSAASAQKRILDVQTANDGTKKVSLDVSMSVKLNAEPPVLQKLAGTYTAPDDKDNKQELFIFNNALWKKNNVFGNETEYVGNNTFNFPGMPADTVHSLTFEIAEDGGIKCTETVKGYPKYNGAYVYVKDK
jgi:catechol 1,2-dioxygenase